MSEEFECAAETPLTDAEEMLHSKRDEILVRSSFARSLERALAQARKDAERYQYIRGHDTVFHVGTILDGIDVTMNGKELDAAIDAALSSSCGKADPDVDGVT